MRRRRFLPTWWKRGKAAVAARVRERRAPIPPAVVQAARERLGLAVAASFGMTECGTVTCTPGDGTARRRVRRPRAPNGEVRIGADGREVPRGEEGGLQVRGASSPAISSAAALPGRRRRLVRHRRPRAHGRRGLHPHLRPQQGRDHRGGENIPVVEIEAALYRIPVADAALVAMPDARLQERACAVTLRAGGALKLEGFAATSRPKGSPSTSGPSGSRCSPRCRARRPARSRSSCCASWRRASAVQRAVLPLLATR